MPVSAVWCFGRADPIRISNRKRTAHGLVLSLASRVSTLATVLPITKQANRGRVAWDTGLGLSNVSHAEWAETRTRRPLARSELA